MAGWDLQTIGDRSICFKYVAGSRTWTEAVTLCAAEGGTLPLPLTSQEDTDYYSYLGSLGYLSSWMDGTDQSVEGTWVTSAGDPITFFNWRLDNGQPDNAGSGEHYLHYRPGWGGVWNDHSATYQDHVMCAKTLTGKTFISWPGK